MFPLFLTFLVFAWQSEIEEKNICSSDKTNNQLNDPQQKTYTYRCFAKYKHNDTNQENLVFAFTLNKFNDEENQICDHFTRFQKELFDFTVIKFINNVQNLTKNLTFSNKELNDVIIKNLEITKSFIEVENDYRTNGKYDLLVC
ncbi:hypothetical protein TUBRATIS_003900 [Tubulinosema ratisbonensis]|uniref:Uncharacterized protein n=1 Tax=Tubulinosema ratisbonensis TaxID=291195 RepID=A0A437APB2_9MICR|nr:hypothetical protein TUBRATIS_003900 [Tubulinosema ratisbonensis]